LLRKPVKLQFGLPSEKSDQRASDKDNSGVVQDDMKGIVTESLKKRSPLTIRLGLSQRYSKQSNLHKTSLEKLPKADIWGG